MQELLDRLPIVVQKQIENYRADYRRDYGDPIVTAHVQAEVYSRIGGYVLALMHTGLIDERERQELFVYMAV